MQRVLLTNCLILSAILTTILSISCKSPRTENKSVDFSEHEAVSIDVKEDYEFKTSVLKVPESGKYHVKCNFESFPIKELDGEYLDGVKLYFDVNHNHSKTTEGGFDKEFIFFRNRSFPAQMGIKFAYSNLDRNEYLIEIAIPWSAIGPTGDIIGFDCSIVDNDGSGDLFENKEVTWNSEDADIFLNPSLYGDLMLATKVRLNPGSKACISGYVSGTLVIDGKLDDAWQSSDYQNISNYTIGRPSSTHDLRARFKSLHNDKYLFFAFLISDDVAVFNDKEIKLCDKGWIENSAGETVWKVDRKHYKNAGGDDRNKLADTTIFLPKGIYNVFYATDETHSPRSWQMAPPTDSTFYGIKIWRTE